MFFRIEELIALLIYFVYGCISYVDTIEIDDACENLCLHSSDSGITCVRLIGLEIVDGLSAEHIIEAVFDLVVLEKCMGVMIVKMHVLRENNCFVIVFLRIDNELS